MRRDGFHLRDEFLGKFPFALGFDIEIADDGKDDGADEIDDEILHGIVDADIEIAADAERFLGAVRVHDHDIGNIRNLHDFIAFCRVEHGAVDCGDDGILLHVLAEKCIGGIFKDLPKHPDGHGKAECGDGKIERGKLEGKFFVAVEHVHKGEADSR